MGNLPFLRGLAYSIQLLSTHLFSCVLAILSVSPLRGAPVYSIVNLGGLGGARSEAFGINSRGAVAGVSRSQDGQADLPVLHDGSRLRSLNSRSGQASGINDSGVVVGTTYDGLGHARATTWDSDEERVLPTFGGADSYALAINNAGNIAGSAIDEHGAAHAFLSKSDSLTDLGDLGGGWSAAYALNDSMDVVGYSMTALGTFRAFRWTAESGMVAVATFGGANSYAVGINAAGHFVGAADTAAGFTRAYIDRGSGLITLGTLGGNNSFAYGINSSDYVVGYGDDGAGRSRAFVWTGGIMYDLNAIVSNIDGWSLDAAYAINDNGQIVGTGTFMGAAAAFRLDLAPRGGVRASRMAFADVAAVPEPSTVSLFVAGTAGLVVWRRRSRR
jgi:probable HAF family extracellular repeat protein